MSRRRICAVTGSHLSLEHGLSYRLIEHDGFAIDARVEMLLSGDTAVAVTKSMGLGVIGVAEALQRLDRSAFFAAVGLPPSARTLLVTFHPATLDADSSAVAKHSAL